MKLTIAAHAASKTSPIFIASLYLALDPVPCSRLSPALCTHGDLHLTYIPVYAARILFSHFPEEDGAELLQSHASPQSAYLRPAWPCRFGHHQQPAFGPWHRPFVQLVEQGLVNAARTVATRFTDPTIRNTMLGLAPQLRICYWDWTLGWVQGLGLANAITRSKLAHTCVLHQGWNVCLYVALLPEQRRSQH